MAPEMLAGDDYDQRVDIFSFGEFPLDIRNFHLKYFRILKWYYRMNVLAVKILFKQTFIDKVCLQTLFLRINLLVFPNGVRYRLDLKILQDR